MLPQVSRLLGPRKITVIHKEPARELRVLNRIRIAIGYFGWRPSLLGWRPSLLGLGWRPLLLGWSWRPLQLGFSLTDFIVTLSLTCRRTAKGGRRDKLGMAAVYSSLQLLHVEK